MTERGWDAIGKEYDKLQAEMSGYYSSSLTIASASIATILGLNGWITSQPENVGPLLYVAPLLVALPAVWAIYHNHRASMRVATYMLTFLEPGTHLAYETRQMMRVLRAEQQRERGLLGRIRWWMRGEPTFPGMVSGMVLALILFDAVLLVVRWQGLVREHPFMTPVSGVLVAIGVSAAVLERWFLDRDYCAEYRREWRTIRAIERAEGGWDPDLPEPGECEKLVQRVVLPVLKDVFEQVESFEPPDGHPCVRRYEVWPKTGRDAMERLGERLTDRVWREGGIVEQLAGPSHAMRICGADGCTVVLSAEDGSVHLSVTDAAFAPPSATAGRRSDADARR